MPQAYPKPLAISNFKDATHSSVNYLTFFNPVLPAGGTYYYLGMAAANNDNYAPSGVEFIYEAVNDDVSSPLFAAPVGYDAISLSSPPFFTEHADFWQQLVPNEYLIYTDVYSMQAPDGYIPIGSFVVSYNYAQWVNQHQTVTETTKMMLANDGLSPITTPDEFLKNNPQLRCVQQGFCETIDLGANDIIAQITSVGDGYGPSYTAFRLPNSGAVYCVAGITDSVPAYDIKSTL